MTVRPGPFITVGRYPRYGRVLAHDDPPGPRRGTGVAADAKRRVATMAVNLNPRKVKGNVHGKEKDHEGSRECERMVRWKRVRRPVWRQSQAIMETSLEMALGLPFASRSGAIQVMENR